MASLTIKSRIALTAMCCLLVIAKCQVAAGDTWSLAKEFSEGKNPSGPWSYGTTSSESIDFATLPETQRVPAHYHTSQLKGWSQKESTVPMVAKNVSNDAWEYDGTGFGSGISTLEPGEVLVHPSSGPSGMATVRWTVPYPAIYDIDATFRRFERMEGTSTGYAVLHNGSKVPKGSGDLLGAGPLSAVSVSLKNIILDTNDYIDFSIDIGEDGHPNYDGTVIDATIRNVPVMIEGDFDGNGILDIVDLDRLFEGVRIGRNLIFDLHKDRNLDLEDRRVWVEDLRYTFFGDANLDGEFNSTDLIQVLTFGKYKDGVPGNANWAEGDWSGDADFDSGDLILAFSSGGYESGPRPIATAVPEPTGLEFLVISAFAIGRTRRRWPFFPAIGSLRSPQSPPLGTHQDCTS